MKPVISIGAQDFTYIRSNHYFYIDKTGFIKEWWENGDIVTLITRPRRFGKTLNLSMLEAFFSNQYEDSWKLYEDLSIWEEERYRKLQGIYPVIFLSFAGIKGDTYETAREGMIQIIIDLYAKYRYLLQGDALNKQEKEYFDYIRPDMSDAVAAMSLHRLALCMNRYYGKKCLYCWTSMIRLCRRPMFMDTGQSCPHLSEISLTVHLRQIHIWSGGL